MVKNNLPDLLLSMQKDHVPFYKLLQTMITLSKVIFRGVPVHGQAIWLAALIEQATAGTVSADAWSIQLVERNLFLLNFLPKTSLGTFTISLVVVSSLDNPGMFLNVENVNSPEESTLTLISDWHSSLDQILFSFLRTRSDIEELV